MKTLNLTLKKKWFDMILSGEKKEEYRENKGYWWNRFNADGDYKRCTECIPGVAHCPSCGFFKDDFKTPIRIKEYDTVVFKNGYSKDAPQFEIECLGIDLRSGGNPKWGADSNKLYFVIKLGAILPSRCNSTVAGAHAGTV